VKYQPPFEPGFAGPVDGIHNANADAGYVNGNPATGEPGSIPPCEALEHVMREIVHVIEWSGQTPNHLDLEQLRKALKTYVEAAIASNAGGTPIYEGLTAEDKPKHKIRPLIEGSNITFDLVENPPGSGRYGLRISAAAAAGGGDDVPLENVGDGAFVFKGFDGTNDELRSIKGINGITVAQNGDVIEVDGAAISGATLATLAPMMLLQQVRAYNANPAAMTGGVYNKRALTTEVVNQIPGASFDGGNAQITLAAGTYRVNFATVGYNCGHRGRLYNVTAGAEVVGGCSIDSWVSSDFGIGAASTGCGRFTIATESVFELQSYAFGGNPRVGDSVSAVNFGNFIDAYIEIIKEA